MPSKGGPVRLPASWPSPSPGAALIAFEIARSAQVEMQICDGVYFYELAKE